MQAVQVACNTGSTKCVQAVQCWRLGSTRHMNLAVHASRVGSPTLCGGTIARGRGRSGGGWALASSQQYNNPALYTSDDAFPEATYWDRRYRQEPTTFEWYRGYSSLEPLLRRYFDPALPLLQVGVGTSTLQLDMVQGAGFTSILNLDYSQVCVDHMAQAHAHVPQLKYVLGDARSMPQLQDGAFAGVLDKGTLDALLCGDAGEGDAALMLREVHRVLAPGGCYMMVTSHPPKTRFRCLSGRPGYCWEAVHVYEVGQQRLLQGPYALHPLPTLPKQQGGAEQEAAAGSASVPEAVAGSGSGEVVLSAEAAALPRQPYSHFVYICRKAGAAPHP